MKEITLTEDNLKIVLEHYSSLIYKCNLCRKTIKPKVSIKDNEVNFKIENNQLRGGCGDRILQDNVCSDCVESYNKIWI